MARATMTDLIQDVRRMTGASASEYIVGDDSFFDDDVLQDMLDARRRDVYRAELVPNIDYLGGGSIQYFQYDSGLRHLEQTSGGTAVFIVEDGPGTNVGTANYTADYRRGVVTFTADQGGTSYYLTARTYDVYGVAADVLQQWATHEALSFDVSTPEVNARRSQKSKMLQSQSETYRRQAWLPSFNAERADVC